MFHKSLISDREEVVHALKQRVQMRLDAGCSMSDISIVVYFTPDEALIATFDDDAALRSKRDTFSKAPAGVEIVDRLLEMPHVPHAVRIACISGSVATLEMMKFPDLVSPPKASDEIREIQSKCQPAVRERVRRRMAEGIQFEELYVVIYNWTVYAVSATQLQEMIDSGQVDPGLTDGLRSLLVSRRYEGYVNVLICGEHDWVHCYFNIPAESFVTSPGGSA